MPILAFGKFTVHGDGSTTGLFQSRATEFVYYSMAPVLWILAAVSCVLAIRFHRWIDPAYTVAKVWVLAPAYAGLVALYLIHASAAYTLFSVTIILLAWRWRKPLRIISAYFYAVLAIASLNFLLLFAWIQDPSEIGMMLLASILYAVFLAFPLCIVRIFLRKRITWKQCFLGYLVGTLVPLIPLWLIFIPSTDNIPTLLFLTLGYASLITVPFIALMKWNVWVRDVVSGTMMVSCDPSE